jgi:hypothetical protein
MSRIVKYLFAALVIIIISLTGCAATIPRQPLSMEQVICPEYSYTTGKGKELFSKYHGNLENIFTTIRARYSYEELEFYPTKKRDDGFYTGGLFFGRDKSDNNDVRYLFIKAGTANVFNTLQTDYNKRAATVFSKYIFNIVKISVAEDVFKYSEVSGINIYLSWWARDFISNQSYGGTVECFQITATKENCKMFVNMEISNQDFANRSKILGGQGNTFLGKIELDLRQIL